MRSSSSAGKQLEAVIEALHKMVQRKLPITLVGAGLPQIAELAGDAKSYAERLFKFPAIGVLDPADARAALVRPAEEEGVSLYLGRAGRSCRDHGGLPVLPAGTGLRGVDRRGRTGDNSR